MQRLSKCVCLQGEVVELAQQHAVDLVVVGPEKPLVNGLADELRANGIPVVGPSKSAAILEESKIASKQFMQAVGIPTARCTWHDGVESALQGLDDWTATDGVVIKSDALAAAKAWCCVILSVKPRRLCMPLWKIPPSRSKQTAFYLKRNSMV